MTIKLPATALAIPPEGPAAKIVIPEDLWNQIPEAKRNNPEELSQYLTDSLRIGILSTLNASITIDTDAIDRVVKDGISEMTSTGDAARRELEALVDSKLTGDKSELANRLKQVIGKDGAIENLFDTLSDSLTNPDLSGSVPAATRAELEAAVEEVKQDLEDALDITDEKTALGKFVRSQNQTIADIQTSLSNQFNEIRNALNVDEILAQKNQEIADLKDKSPHKGIHFENDAVDELQEIASILGDRIDHTGGTGEGKNRSKVGDIVIVIRHQGLPELRIAVEAKSGGINKKNLITEVRESVVNRRAKRGLGLFTKKHIQKRQSALDQVDENYLVAVDWENEDFTNLEIAYCMLRTVVIADELRLQDSESIDVEAVLRRVAQVKDDLGMFQGMKSDLTSVAKTIGKAREKVDILERKIKQQISEAESILKGD